MIHKGFSDWWGFWIAFFIATVFFAAIYMGENDEGYINTRQCVESSGPTSVDPRTGDGPECDKYENVLVKEGVLESGWRGIRENAIFIIMAGLGGLFLAFELQDKNRSSQ